MKAGPLQLGVAPPANRGIAILDFILRIIAIVGTLASAIAMATTNQTLPFFSQFVRFRAKFNDLPSFTFFVVASSIVSAYLILSLAISILHIVKAHAVNSRVLLLFLDTAAMGLLMAGSAAATAIVQLAHNGNNKVNWFSICQQYNDFCKRVSGSLIGSYAGVVILIILILLSGAALSRHLMMQIFFQLPSSHSPKLNTLKMKRWNLHVIWDQIPLVYAFHLKRFDREEWSLASEALVSVDILKDFFMSSVLILNVSCDVEVYDIAVGSFVFPKVLLIKDLKMV
ncbi:casparian strip membrane protein 1 [Tanacetum coccineum]